MIRKSEKEIMKNWRTNLSNPLVSICSITYNHEKFIEEALDSFLMQETDFSFEIIIDDDCSEDKTADIIKEYKIRFPNIIQATLRSKNIGMIQNHLDNIQKAKGRYIALCEGDDYWIDSLKIQKQVNFLDNDDNKNFSFCFHDYDIWNEEEHSYIKNVSSHHFNFPIHSVYTAKRILLGPFVASSFTVMYRNILKRPSCLNSLPFGDKSLEKLLAFYGDGYFMSDAMSCYRNHHKGISKNSQWKALMSKQEKINIELYECLQKKFSNQHIDILNCRINYHKMLLNRTQTKFAFLLNIPKEFKVISSYVKMSKDSFLDRFLLKILLLSKWYLPSSFSTFSEKIYQKLYKYMF